MIQQAWLKATGHRTGKNTLILRYHRLNSVMGSEASPDLHLYVDSGDESEDKPGLTGIMTNNQSSLSLSRKQLGFPLSWDQASKADKRVVTMKEKAHNWHAIHKVFESATQQNIGRDALRARYKRLVALRDESKSCKTPPPAEVEDQGFKVRDEHGVRGRNKEPNSTMIASEDTDDADSIYEIGGDFYENEINLQAQKDSRINGGPDDKPTNIDQTGIGFGHELGSGSGIPTAEMDSATDPDQMLVALQEGKQRWPEVRKEWENATSRRTTAGYMSKQGLMMIPEEDVSVS